MSGFRHRLEFGRVWSSGRSCKSGRKRAMMRIDEDSGNIGIGCEVREDRMSGFQWIVDELYTWARPNPLLKPREGIAGSPTIEIRTGR